MIFLGSNQPPSEWDSQHRAELRAFLESPTGRLALSWVLYRAPHFGDGSDTGKTMVASGRVDGFQQALEELFSLTTEQPPEVLPPITGSPELPDPDDHSQWSKSLGGTQPDPQPQP